MGMGIDPSLRSETLLARKHSASLNIPANIFLHSASLSRRRRFKLSVVLASTSSVVVFNASSVFKPSTSCELTKSSLRNLTTSFHKLSLSPSLARMRLSTFSMETMHVCAVDEGGRWGVCRPSWTVVCTGRGWVSYGDAERRG